MIEFDVDMGYLLEAGELDRVVLTDENGGEPMTFSLSGGECEMEYATEGMKRGWWVCSECGEASDTIKACGGRVPPNFCANCGAKAVKR